MPNRLDSVIRLSDTMATNLSDSRSRIRDTDYAEEVSNMLSAQITQQASLAMMMQAKQNQSNMIMTLLGAA